MPLGVGLNLRKIIDEYILSWFIQREFDYDQLFRKENQPETVPLCGQFDWGVALGLYRKENSDQRSLLGEYICRYKYKEDEKSGLMLARFLELYLQSNNIPSDIDISTTVPVTFKGRAFKPMNYIIKHIDKNLIGEFRPELLIRRKVTPQTKDMFYSEVKRKMVKGMFIVNQRIRITNKSILLFDDIHDSGITLNECASILKDAGAHQVLVVALAATGRGLPGA